MTPVYAVLCFTAVTHGLPERLGLPDYSEMREACSGVYVVSGRRIEWVVQ